MLSSDISVGTILTVDCNHDEFENFGIHVYDLQRPGSALKDKRTLPLVDGSQERMQSKPIPF